MLLTLITIAVLLVVFRVLRRLARKDTTTRLHPQSPRTWWLKVFATLLGIYGIAAFVAGFVSQVLTNRYGWPDESTECPAGFVEQFVSTPDGFHVTVLQSFDRIQVYDADWKFVRGWQVDTHNGHFELRLTDEGEIEVFTARGNNHLKFQLDGTLVFEDKYEGRFPATGRKESRWIETPLLLIPLSHPFLGWLFALSAAILQMLAKRHGRVA